MVMVEGNIFLTKKVLPQEHVLMVDDCFQPRRFGLENEFFMTQKD